MFSVGQLLILSKLKSLMFCDLKNKKIGTNYSQLLLLKFECLCYLFFALVTFESDIH